MRRLHSLTPALAALALALAGAGPAPAQQCPFVRNYYASLQQSSYIQYQMQQVRVQTQSRQATTHGMTTQYPVSTPSRTPLTLYNSQYVPGVLRQTNFAPRSPALVPRQTWQETYAVRTPSRLTTNLSTHWGLSYTPSTTGRLFTRPGAGLFPGRIELTRADRLRLYPGLSVSHRTTNETWYERRRSLQTHYEIRQTEHNHLMTHGTPGRVVTTTRRAEIERPLTVPATHTVARPEVTRRGGETTVDRLKAKVVTQTNLTFGGNATCGSCHHSHPSQPHLPYQPYLPYPPGLVANRPGPLLLIGVDGPGLPVPLLQSGPVRGPNVVARQPIPPECPPLPRLVGTRPDEPRRGRTPEQPAPSPSPGQVASSSVPEAAWLPPEPAASLSRISSAPPPGDLARVTAADDVPVPSAASPLLPPPLPPLPRAAWEPPPPPARHPSAAAAARTAVAAGSVTSGLAAPALPPLPEATQPWAPEESVALR
jgi:hypothetical protein